MTAIQDSKLPVLFTISDILEVGNQRIERDDEKWSEDMI